MGFVSVCCLSGWLAAVRLVVSLLLWLWVWQLGLAGFCCRFWAALLGVWVSAPGCLGFCSGWGRLVFSGCSGAVVAFLVASCGLALGSRRGFFCWSPSWSSRSLSVVGDRQESLGPAVRELQPVALVPRAARPAGAARAKKTAAVRLRLKLTLRFVDFLKN